MEEINIPISVQSIDTNAFQRCVKLASLFIPFSVTTIGANAFEDCTGLETFTMDDFSYLNSIGGSAFAGCTKLASLESLTSLVEGVEITITTEFTVNDNAFSGCRALTSLTIPTWMISVGSNAFNDCTNLKTLTLNTIPRYNPTSGVDITTSQYEQVITNVVEALSNGTRNDDIIGLLQDYDTSRFRHSRRSL